MEEYYLTAPELDELIVFPTAGGSEMGAGVADAATGDGDLVTNAAAVVQLGTDDLILLGLQSAGPVDDLFA